MAGLKLMAELGLDGSGFEAGFHRAQGMAVGVAEGIRRVIMQTIGVITLEEAMRRTVDTAKELAEAGERLAIAPEQLQVMRQAAKNAGLEFEKLVEIMEKLSIAREKALIPGQEGKDARRAFGALGIGHEQLSTMTNAQLLLGPVRNAALGRNPEEIGIVFRELGIRAFGGLIPVLKTNFEELEKKMRDAGSIMSSEVVAKLKILSTEFSYLAQVVSVALGPVLIKLALALLRFAMNVEAAYEFFKTLFSREGNQQITKSMEAQSGFGGPTKRQVELAKEIQKDALKDAAESADLRVAAAEARDKAIDKWVKFFVDLELKFKELSESLAHPKVADFTSPAIPEKMQKKALETPSDALVKVGNFLGAGDLAISRIAERQVYWLQKIERNTAQKSQPQQYQLNSGYPSLMGPNFPHN